MAQRKIVTSDSTLHPGDTFFEQKTDETAVIIKPRAMTSLAADNATGTTVTTGGTQYAIGGTWGASSNNKDFTHATGGVLTYTGENTAVFNFAASGTAAPPAALDYTVSMIKGEATVVESVTFALDDASTLTAFSLVGEVSLSTDDTLQLQVTASDDSGDFTATGLQLLVWM